MNAPVEFTKTLKPRGRTTELGRGVTVQRIAITLDPRSRVKVEAMAKARNTSVSHVIRDAIGLAYDRYQREP